MTKTLDSDVLRTLSGHILQTTALDFPPDLYPELEARARAAARDLGYPHVEPLIRLILADSLTLSQNQQWLGHLTVGETYFWREPQAFQALEQVVIPLLTKARASGSRKLTLWSAGCSSGEEAYSLAIALSRAIPDPASWKIRILGTDLNPLSLEKARAGKYTAWSFRNTPDWFRTGYFTEDDKQWEIKPEIRRLVGFETQNLNQLSSQTKDPTDDFDLILCRNVLMYFSEDRAKAVLKNLHHCLASDGWLLVSASELSVKGLGIFQPDVVSETHFYRRNRRLPEKARFDPPPSVPLSLFRKPSRSPKREPKPRFDLKSIRALADQGYRSEALELTRTYLAQDGLDPLALYLQAVIFQEMQRTDEAIKALRRTLSIDPAHALASFSLGHLFRTRGLPEQARQWFGNALRTADSHGIEEIVPGSDNLTFGVFKTLVQDALRMGGRP